MKLIKKKETNVKIKYGFDKQHIRLIFVLISIDWRLSFCLDCLNIIQTHTHLEWSFFFFHIWKKM